MRETISISDRPGKQNEKAVEDVKKQTDSFIDYNRSDIIFDGEQHVSLHLLRKLLSDRLLKNRNVTSNDLEQIQASFRLNQANI